MLSANSKRINQVKIGSVLSYVQMALSVIIGLLYTPYMIRLLGQSEYGLYNTVSSTISMLSILNLGFTAGYIRYYAKYKSENDDESIYRLNGLFLKIFSAIGLIAAVCGVYLSFNLNMVFKEGLTTEEYTLARKLMILLTIHLAISFPMSVFPNIITAHEQFVVLKLIGMINTLVGPLVTLPLLLMGYRSVVMVLVTLGISIIVDFIYIYFVIVKLREKFIFRSSKNGIFLSLLYYTGFIAINIIVDQVNTNIDKIILGRFIGTTGVAVYSVGFTLYMHYMSISTAVSSVFTPRIHRMINSDEKEGELKKRLTDLFVRVGRIQFIILSLICLGFCIFGKFFIRHWAGEGYDESYYVTIILMIPSIVTLTQNLGIEIQRAQNKHQFRSIAYLGMAIVNFIISVFLCQKYGPIGCTIGTAISLVVANGIVMNVYYNKKCNIEIKQYWINILHLIKGLIIPIIFGITLQHLFHDNSLYIYIGKLLLFSTVYFVSMWYLGFNQYEKQLVMSLFRIRREIK